MVIMTEQDKASVQDSAQDIATTVDQATDEEKRLELESKEQSLKEQQSQLLAAQQKLQEEQAKLQAEQAKLQAEKEQQRLVEETFVSQQQQLFDDWQQKFAAWHQQQQDQLASAKQSGLDQVQADETAARQASVERLQQYQRELEEQRSSLLAKFSTQLQGMLANQEKQLDAALQERLHTVEQREQEAAQRERALGEKEAALNAQHQQVMVLQQTVKQREEQLPQLAQELSASQLQVMQGKVNELQQFVAQQQQDNAYLNSVIATYQRLEQKLGGQEPEMVLQELKDRELRIAQLRQELTERPPRELEQRYDELAAREKQLDYSNRELKAKLAQMSATCAIQAADTYEKENLRQQLEQTQQLLDLSSAHNNKLQGELKRLTAQYKDPSSREERISNLQKAYITAEPRFISPEWGNDANDELKWLCYIDQRCRESGFIFPTRLLHAFHTSLKCADWSPLTVLAGVSGTGKSKLPQLYSVFGGINFMLLSVQPNWDSQEAMLGFFNSIDNVFDAQPVLRFLAQSQKQADANYPYGMKKAVNIVLLDEMNLAHVELYFAEFLSKLELRHGLADNDLPHIDVKIGADIAPYQLTLGRNVLWVGTMNEDETTKALSDKVIDRSCILHFPRPKTLNRMSGTNSIPRQPDEWLPVDVWNKWLQHESAFSSEEIAPFKQFIEDINAALAKAGRALGHRVWQSIEAYMANYPAVIALRNRHATPAELNHAMRIAFEDQLVLKVMPKLRGIETRGVAMQECLEVIGSKLAEEKYNILDDFNAACELGYGQFMWNSAAYLEKNGDDVGFDVTTLRN